MVTLNGNLLHLLAFRFDENPKHGCAMVRFDTNHVFTWLTLSETTDKP